MTNGKFVMSCQMAKSKIILYLKLLRAPFFTASVMPIFVGTALAYSTAGVFDFTLFILALAAITALHAGANITNDYFDHLSGNDWLNDNSTPFNGGSRLIQLSLLSPKQVITFALALFVSGAVLGLIIVMLTKSFFVFMLGVVGLVGGYFYTAKPLKLGYRTMGELAIGLLFGILPVYGAYYIQTASFDFQPLLPACIVAVLIFQIILANEFADFSADKAVNKRTIVVNFGIKKAADIYKISLLALCALMIAFCFTAKGSIASVVALLIALTFSGLCLKFAKPALLCQKGKVELSKTTILLHLSTGLAMTATFLLSKPA